jgi:DNA-binding FadR family transcriptional regulator
MPRLPDLARRHGVNRDTLAPAVAILETGGLVWAGPRRRTIVRYGMSRPRRLRGNLVGRNLMTDSPGGRIRPWRRRIPARPGSPQY